MARQNIHSVRLVLHAVGHKYLTQRLTEMSPPNAAPWRVLARDRGCVQTADRGGHRLVSSRLIDTSHHWAQRIRDTFGQSRSVAQLSTSRCCADLGLVSPAAFRSKDRLGAWPNAEPALIGYIAPLHQTWPLLVGMPLPLARLRPSHSSLLVCPANAY